MTKQPKIKTNMLQRWSTAVAEAAKKIIKNLRDHINNNSNMLAIHSVECYILSLVQHFTITPLLALSLKILATIIHCPVTSEGIKA